MDLQLTNLSEQHVSAEHLFYMHQVLKFTNLTKCTIINYF